MIGNETLERVEKYIYLGQTVSANPAYGREIKRRIGMGWSAFGKYEDIMNTNLPLSLKRKVYNQCILSVRLGGLAPYKRTRAKPEECTERIEEEKARYHRRDRKRATWIREQTKIEDILITMKKKKWSWVGHIMRRMHNRWTKRVTEWQPRNSKRSQGRQKIRWRDEIVAFAGVGWSTSNRERWKGLGKAFVLQWTGNGCCCC